MYSPNPFLLWRTEGPEFNTSMSIMFGIYPFTVHTEKSCLLYTHTHTFCSITHAVRWYQSHTTACRWLASTSFTGYAAAWLRTRFMKEKIKGSHTLPPAFSYFSLNIHLNHGGLYKVFISGMCCRPSTWWTRCGCDCCTLVVKSPQRNVNAPALTGM